MPHVQRTGRIDRDELDLDPLAAAVVDPAVALPLADHLLEHPVEPGVGHVEVDEARPRHLDLGDEVVGIALQVAHDGLRHLPRVLPHAARHRQRHVGGEVAVLLQPGARQLDGHALAGLGQAGFGCGQGVADAACEVLLDHRRAGVEEPLSPA